MTFTQLKYGFAWVVTGVVITGTTIYVANRMQVKQIDKIELLQAVIERCLVTQYGVYGDGTAKYRVSPPNYVRVFTESTNVVVPAGVPQTNAPGTNVYEVYIRTNTIGFITDVELITILDAKIKELIPYFMRQDTVYDGSPNMQSWTAASLFSEYEIGDGVSQFTKVPSIGGEEARYSGEYPLQIYTNTLFEMYKVLHVLKWSQESFGRSINGSAQNRWAWVKTFSKHTYSNEVTEAVVEAYWPSWQAECTGREEDYTYYCYYHGGCHPNTTDWVRVHDVSTNGLPPPGDCANRYTCELYPTWSEVKDCVEWNWYYSVTNRYEAPYRKYTNYVTVATDEIDLAVGHTVYSKVRADSYYCGDEACTNSIFTCWEWLGHGIKQYATWQWWNSFHNELNCICFKVYAKAIASPYLHYTEIAEGGTNYDFFRQPREWEITFDGEYAEFSGLSTNEFHQINSGYTRTNGNYIEIEFGSDEGNPLALAGTFPTWCSEPDKGTDWNDNTGSVGKDKGAWLLSFFDGEQVTFAIRKWNFSYCTDALP